MKHLLLITDLLVLGPTCQTKISHRSRVFIITVCYRNLVFLCKHVHVFFKYIQTYFKKNLLKEHEVCILLHKLMFITLEPTALGIVLVYQGAVNANWRKHCWVLEIRFLSYWKKKTKTKTNRINQKSLTIPKESIKY